MGAQGLPRALQVEGWQEMATELPRAAVGKEPAEGRGLSGRKRNVMLNCSLLA